jgi:hypothetical protein
MLPTTCLMFLGTVISVAITLDFIRPVRQRHPF